MSPRLAIVSRNPSEHLRKPSQYLRKSSETFAEPSEIFWDLRGIFGNVLGPSETFAESSEILGNLRRVFLRTTTGIHYHYMLHNTLYTQYLLHGTHSLFLLHSRPLSTPTSAHSAKTLSLSLANLTRHSPALSHSYPRPI